MINISQSDIEKKLATPLTYFKDEKGFIYWSKGIRTPNNKLVSKLVYIPLPQNKADRIQIQTKTTYIKRVIDNCIDMPSIEDLPIKTQAEIKNIMWDNPLNQAKFITVSIDNIKEVYNPIKAFTDEINSKKPHSIILNDIKKLFKESGISESCYGLYGALQVGMQKLSGESIKDIDLIIYGLDNYKLFRKIDDKDLNKYGFARYNREDSFPYQYNDIILKNLHRRDKALALFYKNGLKIEIRIVRLPKDKKTFPIDFFIKQGVESTFSGIIENDEETVATSPSTYVVRTDDNRVIKVTSLNYRMIGAAFINERVSVKGLETSDNFVVLTNPDHYIVLD